VADEFPLEGKREGQATVTLTRKRWLLSLARCDIGTRPIPGIGAAEIPVPLRRVESQGNHETARRLRATIAQVFRWAVASAKAVDDPTFGLRGALTAPVVTDRPRVNG
jgi:hypothetical protein